MTELSPATATPLHVPTWAWVLALVAIFAFYLLTQENGVLLTANHAQLLHEVTHDARHALGVPCH